MSRNDSTDFAQRLYARLPAHYRVRDAERNLPLYALLRVIATQAANLRRDLDDLWDNFFIETCDEWVVPYIGALLGTKLLSNPVAQTNRLDVWNTIAWRRSRGTPRMLQALATAIAGWPTDFAEFYRTLGWSQNMNHLRLSAQLTPDLRNGRALGLLGTAADPLLHAADFKPSFDLDQTRITQGSLGIGHPAWHTDGRYQIRNLGFFVHRLQVFPVFGATPAAADPGIAPGPDAGLFTFDPLHREVPLFSAKRAAPITRTAFAEAPRDFLGTDFSIARNGLPLATAMMASTRVASSPVPFAFGSRGTGMSLDPNAGLRLMATDATAARHRDFVIAAEWQLDDGSVVVLGTLSARVALAGLPGAFQRGLALSGSGVLRVTVALAEPGSPWPPPPFTMPRPARFPGAVLAVRTKQNGALRQADGLYVYLPEVSLATGAPVTFWVADDGSTYSDPNLDIETLVRSAEGQVYPPLGAEPSAVPSREFTEPNRGPGGMVVTDPSRFGELGVVFAAEVFTGEPQLLGAIPTADASGTVFPELGLATVWPALGYAPNPKAERLEGLLDILVRPLPNRPGSPPMTPVVPPVELIIVNRSGHALLVYLPEIADPPTEGVRFFVAQDGSTYYYPASEVARQSALTDNSLAQLILARAASGQVWPIPGRWPAQQRIAVSRDLVGPESAARLVVGQLAIDPERGRFALPPGDPARAARALSADYVEAFGDRVGALNFNRQINPAALATRVVSSTGDAESGLSVAANAQVYSTLSAALAAAQDGDIIEIADSATYAEADPVVLADPLVQRLTIRARAGNRPCLSSYASDGTPLTASLMTLVRMDQLVLDGLLISGGPVVLHEPVSELRMLACTLDPANAATGALISDSANNGRGAEYLLCRCVTGALCLGDSVSMVTVADSIIDGGGKFAIVGAISLGSPPAASLVPIATNATVQLERVTVLGRVFCDVLKASDCLFDDYIVVEDQQIGCIRFSRYEKGSTLPRRYRCVPTEEEAGSCPDHQRCLPPLFNSRRYGRPSYAQLASSCPAEILTASEAGAEVGAFASALNGVRIGNLRTKLQEFMPVGLSAAIVAAT